MIRTRCVATTIWLTIGMSRTSDSERNGSDPNKPKVDVGYDRLGGSAHEAM
jgi:hypothetical protein